LAQAFSAPNVINQSEAPLDPTLKKGTYMGTTQEISTIINGVPVCDLYATIDAIKGKPSLAKFKFRVRNQWQGGSYNLSTVEPFTGANQELAHPRPFVLEADEPEVLLGRDLAANPVEHLLHALASCVTTSMVYQAAKRGIHIHQVESFIEGNLDLHGFLDLDETVRKGYQEIRMHFKMDADVPEERLREVFELGTGHSPVFDSLTNGVPVIVTAEAKRFV
jgi:uncharacterized OsmC-like protein